MNREVYRNKSEGYLNTLINYINDVIHYRKRYTDYFKDNYTWLVNVISICRTGKLPTVPNNEATRRISTHVNIITKQTDVCTAKNILFTLTMEKKVIPICNEAIVSNYDQFKKVDAAINTYVDTLNAFLKHLVYEMSRFPFITGGMQSNTRIRLPFGIGRSPFTTSTDYSTPLMNINDVLQNMYDIPNPDNDNVGGSGRNSDDDRVSRIYTSSSDSSHTSSSSSSSAPDRDQIGTRDDERQSLITPSTNSSFIGYRRRRPNKRQLDTDDDDDDDNMIPPPIRKQTDEDDVVDDDVLNTRSRRDIIAENKFLKYVKSILREDDLNLCYLQLLQDIMRYTDEPETCNLVDNGDENLSRIMNVIFLGMRNSRMREYVRNVLRRLSPETLQQMYARYHDCQMSERFVAPRRPYSPRKAREPATKRPSPEPYQPAKRPSPDPPYQPDEPPYQEPPLPEPPQQVSPAELTPQESPATQQASPVDDLQGVLQYMKESEQSDSMALARDIVDSMLQCLENKLSAKPPPVYAPSNLQNMADQLRQDMEEVREQQEVDRRVDTALDTISQITNNAEISESIGGGRGLDDLERQEVKETDTISVTPLMQGPVTGPSRISASPNLPQRVSPGPSRTPQRPSPSRTPQRPSPSRTPQRPSPSRTPQRVSPGPSSTPQITIRRISASPQRPSPSKTPQRVSPGPSRVIPTHQEWVPTSSFSSSDETRSSTEDRSDEGDISYLKNFRAVPTGTTRRNVSPPVEIYTGVDLPELPRSMESYVYTIFSQWSLPSEIQGTNHIHFRNGVVELDDFAISGHKIINQRGKHLYYSIRNTTLDPTIRRRINEVLDISNKVVPIPGSAPFRSIIPENDARPFALGPKIADLAQLPFHPKEVVASLYITPGGFQLMKHLIFQNWQHRLETTFEEYSRILPKLLVITDPAITYLPKFIKLNEMINSRYSSYVPYSSIIRNPYPFLDYELVFSFYYLVVEKKLLMGDAMSVMACVICDINKHKNFDESPGKKISKVVFMVRQLEKTPNEYFINRYIHAALYTRNDIDRFFDRLYKFFVKEYMPTDQNYRDLVRIYSY